MNRRGFLQSAAVAAGSLAAAPALAKQMPDPPGTTPPARNWNDPASAPYPDAAVEVFDPRMIAVSAGPNDLRRIAWDMKFTEGPVYFADHHRLIWSDIPANKLFEYNEVTDEVRVFRENSNHANSNSRHWQGRLLSCEQGTRRVTRTEYDGSITVIADSYQGKKLNSPNGIVAKKDGTLWFTDPTSESCSSTRVTKERKPSCQATSTYSIQKPASFRSWRTTSISPTACVSRPMNQSSTSPTPVSVRSPRKDRSTAGSVCSMSPKTTN